ncbi:hypothetical protein [Streptomyces hainanensis]|uniref:SAM-dependent methyltransferase n=1 Tax=Streptomyces hainanensis TaxID=402648 RepID=A0A4R4T8V8_9ACTN|nr:hypothetical protein [Streptomyces hainanensis]TDC73520.1 hypothetical protein E1283_18960 [Streptomyces hainanensis]
MWREAAREFVAAAEARKAAGHWVFSTVVTLATSGPGPDDGLSDVIEGVELAGWQLDRMESVTSDPHDARPALLLVFRQR